MRYREKKKKTGRERETGQRQKYRDTEIEREKERKNSREEGLDLDHAKGNRIQEVYVHSYSLNWVNTSWTYSTWST